MCQYLSIPFILAWNFDLCLILKYLFCFWDLKWPRRGGLDETREAHQSRNVVGSWDRKSTRYQTYDVPRSTRWPRNFCDSRAPSLSFSPIANPFSLIFIILILSDFTVRFFLFFQDSDVLILLGFQSRQRRPICSSLGLFGPQRHSRVGQWPN